MKLKNLEKGLTKSLDPAMFRIISIQMSSRMTKPKKFEPNAAWSCFRPAAPLIRYCAFIPRTGPPYAEAVANHSKYSIELVAVI